MKPDANAAKAGLYYVAGSTFGIAASCVCSIRFAVDCLPEIKGSPSVQDVRLRDCDEKFQSNKPEVSYDMEIRLEFISSLNLPLMVKVHLVYSVCSALPRSLISSLYSVNIT